MESHTAVAPPSSELMTFKAEWTYFGDKQIQDTYWHLSVLGSFRYQSLMVRATEAVFHYVRNRISNFIGNHEKCLKLVLDKELMFLFLSCDLRRPAKKSYTVGRSISPPPTVSELCTLLVFLLDVIPLVRSWTLQRWLHAGCYLCSYQWCWPVL